MKNNSNNSAVTKTLTLLNYELFYNFCKTVFLWTIFSILSSVRNCDEA